MVETLEQSLQAKQYYKYKDSVYRTKDPRRAREKQEAQKGTKNEGPRSRDKKRVHQKKSWGSSKEPGKGRGSHKKGQGGSSRKETGIGKEGRGEKGTGGGRIKACISCWEPEFGTRAFDKVEKRKHEGGRDARPNGSPTDQKAKHTGLTRGATRKRNQTKGSIRNRN